MSFYQYCCYFTLYLLYQNNHIAVLNLLAPPLPHACDIYLFIYFNDRSVMVVEYMSMFPVPLMNYIFIYNKFKASFSMKIDYKLVLHIQNIFNNAA